MPPPAEILGSWGVLIAGVCVDERVALALLTCTPLLFVLGVLAVAAFGRNPRVAEEEKERMIKAVAESEWARALARKMATTPEAQERVAHYLARSLVEGAVRAGL
jgi:hypothetical protein